MTPEQIAKVCHEANRAYCAVHGDLSQQPWHLAPAWQVQSAINGVNFRIANPAAGPEASHDNWAKEKYEAGWKYGAVKDEVAKTHPCLVTFHKLPEDQQRKDVLFTLIVSALHTPMKEILGHE